MGVQVDMVNVMNGTVFVVYICGHHRGQLAVQCDKDKRNALYTPLSPLYDTIPSHRRPSLHLHVATSQITSTTHRLEPSRPPHDTLPPSTLQSLGLPSPPDRPVSRLFTLPRTIFIPNGSRPRHPQHTALFRRRVHLRSCLRRIYSQLRLRLRLGVGTHARRKHRWAVLIGVQLIEIRLPQFNQLENPKHPHDEQMNQEAGGEGRKKKREEHVPPSAPPPRSPKTSPLRS